MCIKLLIGNETMDNKKIDKEAITRRIQRLLALSESSNPNEAAIALNRAQQMMKEFDINIDDINFYKVEELDVPVPSIIAITNILGSMSDAIKNAYGIYVCTAGSGRSRVLRLFGEHFRLVAAEYTITVLSRMIVEARDAYHDKLIQERDSIVIIDFDKQLHEYKTTHKRCTDKDLQRLFTQYNNQVQYKKLLSSTMTTKVNAYISGWVNAVSQNIQPFDWREKEEEHINSYVKSKYHVSRRTSYRNLSQMQMDCMRTGKEDGKNVTIAQGVNTSVKRGQIGFDK